MWNICVVQTQMMPVICLFHQFTYAYIVNEGVVQVADSYGLLGEHKETAVRVYVPEEDIQ